jgi:hypothetical protein
MEPPGEVLETEVSEKIALTNRVLVTEGKLQAISLIQVKWVLVKDLDVHLPFLQIVTFHDCNSRREMLLHLGQNVRETCSRFEQYVRVRHNMLSKRCHRDKGDKDERGICTLTSSCKSHRVSKISILVNFGLKV